MEKIWVVVAGTGRARIFGCDGRNGELEEVADLVHPESRLQAREVGTDAPGRSFDSRGNARHAMSPREGPQRTEMRRFASEIADRLRDGHERGQFERFYLIAEPRMLGSLREALDDPTRSHLSGDIALNLVTHTVADIRAHLPDYL